MWDNFSLAVIERWLYWGGWIVALALIAVGLWLDAMGYVL
jgi:hypothetical protein